MKRFEFRLEQVLKVKRQHERLAELRQQQCRLRLEATQAGVTALNRQILELAVAVDKGMRGASSLTVLSSPTEDGEDPARGGGQQFWMAQLGQTRLLSEALTSAENQVQQAQQALSQADVQRRQIATEVEAYLHLRQEQWQAHRQEMARAQQEQLDELGMRRWQVGQQDSARAGKDL